MTIELLHPDDSGEVARLRGETRTRIIRADTGENTQNLGRYAIHASVVGAIPRKVIELDDTVTFHMPETIGVVADTETLTLLGSLTAGLDGDLRPAAPGPRPTGPLPPNPPPAPKPGYVGRHRDPLDRVAVLGEGAWERMVEAAKPASEPRRLRVQVGVGAFVFLLAAVTVTVLRVFW
jgi:hypothetical protein